MSVIAHSPVNGEPGSGSATSSWVWKTSRESPVGVTVMVSTGFWSGRSTMSSVSRSQVA